MKSHRLSTALRRTALAILFAGMVGWAAAGARFGWTQTSIVTMQRDEVTGIDFPQRRNAFVPGIEVPLLAFAVAGSLLALSWAAARRTGAVHA